MRLTNPPKFIDRFFSWLFKKGVINELIFIFDYELEPGERDFEGVQKELIGVGKEAVANVNHIKIIMIIFLGFFIISMVSAINYTGCEKGRHTIKAYAQDIAGNINSTPEIVFYVDIQPPWIYLNTSVNGSNLTVNITYYDCAVYWNQAYSCWYKIDSGLNISLSNCSQAEITNISYGNHNITVYANDSAGNINSTTASFTYSSCFPSLTKEWIINCADQCLFNNPITYDGNISMVGVGSVILQSTLRLIQPWKIYKENGCVFRVENGGRIE